MGLFEQFPYTNFHELNLDWILRKLKEFGVVIEGLDEKIKDAINSGLKELDIVRLIMDAMTEYGLVVNVKAPPNNLSGAIGDGSANDTIAIQGCIDYANVNGGKSVFFPSGKYLTNSLILKDNVSLVGFDRSTTHLVLSGGATKPLISGTTKNNTISKLTLDGNMSIQVNDIDVISLSGGQYDFNDIEITDGYSLMELNLNDYLQGSNIRFGKGVIDALVTKGIGDVNLENLMFEELSVLRGRYIINNTVDDAVFKGIHSICKVETAIKNISDGSVFIGQLLNNVENILDSGTNTYYNFYSKGTQEKIDREEADRILQDNIDAEALARIEADNTLQGNIDAEVIARTESDDILQELINAEAITREQADDIIKGLIDEEVIAREQADNNIQTNVDAEALARTEADSVLEQLISEKGGDLVVNVKDFGAIGDGKSHPLSEFYTTIQEAQEKYPFATALTDEVDYCAIQSAIDNVHSRLAQWNISGGWNAGGGVVYIPSGNYRITSLITLKNNVSLIGESRYSVLITAYAIGLALKNLGAGANIKNMTFLGAGIHFVSNYASTVENVAFFNIKDEITKVKKATTLQLTVGQRFINVMYFNCDICIEINGNAGVGPNTSCYFEHMWIQQCVTGVVLIGTKTNYITTSSFKDSIIEYCTTAFNFNGVIRDFIIDNVHLEGNDTEIKSAIIEGSITINSASGGGGVTFLNVGALLDTRNKYVITNSTYPTFYIQTGVQNLDIYTDNFNFIPSLPASCRLYNIQNELYTLTPTEGFEYKNGQVLKARTVPSVGVYSKVCITTGFEARTEWTSNTAYALNKIVYSGTKVYKCIQAGTSGETLPTGTVGEIIDGGAKWTYLGVLGVFKDLIVLEEPIVEP